MREKARHSDKTFALTADVAEAHRQIPIHPRDWHLLGWQIEFECDVYINKVGTFGVASASCFWSRAAAQCIPGRVATTWHQLVEDDFISRRAGQTAVQRWFRSLSCARPLEYLSIEKTAGSDTVTWVGFELLHRMYHLDLSSDSRLVHQMDRKSHQGTHDQNRQFR